MGSCCEKRRDIYGTCEGDAKSNHREVVEMGELHKLFEFVARSPGNWLYRCRICGQHWLDFEEPTGHGERSIYRKTTLDEFKSKYPDAKFEPGFRLEPGSSR